MKLSRGKIQKTLTLNRKKRPPSFYPKEPPPSGLKFFLNLQTAPFPFIFSGATPPPFRITHLPLTAPPLLLLPQPGPLTSLNPTTTPSLPPICLTTATIQHPSTLTHDVSSFTEQTRRPQFQPSIDGTPTDSIRSLLRLIIDNDPLSIATT